MSKLFGYVRTSTRTQNEDRQLVALRGFGVADSNIHVEKQSGKDFERPIYQRLMKKLKHGDTLVIKSIDHVAFCIFLIKRKHDVCRVADSGLRNVIWSNR